MSWEGQTKAGQGWLYDENVDYDAEIEPETDNPVYYDSAGLESTWTGQSKS